MTSTLHCTPTATATWQNPTDSGPVGSPGEPLVATPPRLEVVRTGSAPETPTALRGPRLRPGTGLHHLGGGVIRVGSTPGSCLTVLHGRDCINLLRMLDGTRDQSELESLAEAAGLRRDEFQALVRDLDDRGFLDPRIPAPAPWVRIVGSGPVAERLAAALHDNGITDVAWGDGPLDPGPDLTIVAPAGGRGVDIADDLARAGRPHLLVHGCDDTGFVGPLVTGDGPCLRCVDADRSTSDLLWPAMTRTWEQDLPRWDPEPVAASLQTALAVAFAVEYLRRGGAPDAPGYSAAAHRYSPAVRGTVATVHREGLVTLRDHAVARRACTHWAPDAGRPHAQHCAGAAQCHLPEIATPHQRVHRSGRRTRQTPVPPERGHHRHTRADWNCGTPA